MNCYAIDDRHGAQHDQSNRCVRQRVTAEKLDCREKQSQSLRCVYVVAFFFLLEIFY